MKAFPPLLLLSAQASAPAFGMEELCTEGLEVSLGAVLSLAYLQGIGL